MLKWLKLAGVLNVKSGRNALGSSTPAAVVRLHLTERGN